MSDNEQTPEILLPTNDFIFKLLFGDENGIERLTSLLQSVLNLSHNEYGDITILDPHLLREYKGDKLGILDVKVKTKTGKIVNVEIQVNPSSSLRERVIYYASKLITGQLKSGNDHSRIKKVICIIITDHIFIRNNEEYHNCHDIRNVKTGEQFSDVLEIHSIELPKIPKADDGTQLWWWTKFLSAKSKEEFDMLAEQNPQVQKAVVRLKELSADERTRMVYESIHKKEWDNWAREMEIRIKFARRLLKLGRPTEEIIEDTGLSREEIEELQQEELQQ